MFVFGPNVALEIHFTKLSYTVIDTVSSSVAFANFGHNVFKFIIGECLSTFREDVEAKMWAPAQKTNKSPWETSETMFYSVSTCPKKSVNSHCKWADMRRQSQQHFLAFLMPVTLIVSSKRLQWTGVESNSLKQGHPCPLLMHSPRWNNQKTPFDGAFPLMTSTNPKMSRRAHQWERQPPGKGLQYAFLHHNNYDSYQFFSRWLHYSLYLRLQISLFQLFRDKWLEGEVLKH